MKETMLFSRNFLSHSSPDAARDQGTPIIRPVRPCRRCSARNNRGRPGHSAAYCVLITDCTAVLSRCFQRLL